MFTQVAETEFLQQPAESVGTTGAKIGNPAFADDERLSPSRGIVTAVLLSAPFWALVGFTVYLLM